MAEITPNTQKAILLRVLLLIVAVEINLTATNFIQDQNNNVFKQAQPLKFSLHIFLLPLLAEFGIFLYANAYSERRYGSMGMWSKTCLFIFILGACPAVCLMEHHRMGEVQFFYGKWRCAYDEKPLPDYMKLCPVGKSKTVTCFREREINTCFVETFDVIPKYPVPEPSGSGTQRKEAITNGFYAKKGDFKEYPELTGLFRCSPPSFEKVEGRGLIRGCNVKKYQEGLDQNNFWTYTCYFVKKENGYIDKIKPSSGYLCSKVKNVCRLKNLTLIYASMTMQCRLGDLYLILSVTFACWILPNFALKSGKLPILLLTNMLTAADIFDLLNCFDEPLAPIPDIWRTVICVWPASLLHLFCNNISSLVDTSTEADNGWDDSVSHSSASVDSHSEYSGTDSLRSDSGSWEGYVEETNNQHLSLRGFSNIDTCRSNVSPLKEWIACPHYVFVDSILSALLQDLPFLCVRCYLLSHVNRYNPQIYFFAAKNALFILVQLFRASVLLLQLLLSRCC